MTSKKKKNEAPTYAAASGELEDILQEIESGQIDLDELTEKVARAAELLALCRQKLAATETKVKKVTDELTATHAAPDGAADGAPAGDDDTPDDDDPPFDLDEER
ncbi:MAG: exodeoxyribonuclease VII small subunit [Planctomycetes bacterium]|nr:exodeoxyribonuclease VII small subunit [Planctomycetota bacterium]